MPIHRPLTRLTRITSALAVVGLAGAVSILPACGGDDGDTGAAGETDFCALVMQTSLAAYAASDDEFETGFYRALGELADRAPTDELRTAMEAFAEYADKTADLDPDDPEHMWDAIELLGEQSFIDANDALNTYLEVDCNFSNAAD